MKFISVQDIIVGIFEYFFLLSIYNSISTITIDNSLLLQAN